MKAILNCLLVLTVFLILCSCKAKKEIQTEFIYVNRTDTLQTVKWRVDSINVHDSIVTLIKGDTVQIERWHTAYRDRLRVDTVEKVRTETIYQTRTDTQIQEVNRLYWWQVALMWIGAVALGCGLLWAILRIKKR